MSDPVYTPLAPGTPGTRTVLVSDWSGAEQIVMTPAEHRALFDAIYGTTWRADVYRRFKMEEFPGYVPGAQGTTGPKLLNVDGVRDWVKLKLAYLRAGMGI